MSDILIRGMEMPKNCEECDVKAVCKNYWRLIRKQYERPSWCPLVPVPPHGDLVERQAVLNTFSVHMNRTLHFVTIRDTVPTIIPASE